MGGAQSTPSRPSSPSTPIVHQSASRRLSSFGRSSRRKAGQLTPSTPLTPSTLITPSEPSLSDISSDVSTSSNSKLGVDDGIPAVDVKDGLADPLSKARTPCLPTAPGPPVAFPTSAGLGRDPSSFFAPSSRTASSSLIPPYPQPDTAAADPSPTPPTPAPSAFRPSHSRNLSLPNSARPTDRAMSGTLTAYLGFSGPGEPEPVPLPSPSPEGPASEAVDWDVDASEWSTESGRSDDHPESNEGGDEADSASIANVTEAEALAEVEAIRVERAELDAESAALEAETAAIQDEREQLSSERSELADLQTRLDTAREELERSRAELAGLRARNRVPVGAMLVIQGMAQTRFTSAAAGENVLAPGQSADGAAGTDGGPGGSGSGSASSGTSGAAASRPQRPSMGRRISDGSLFRRRREIEQERGASLEQQARMISGLLTVAAAATANTLLAVPEEPSPSTPARTGLTGALQSLLNRLRPTRTPQHGIEAALGQYLQNVVRDSRRPPPPGSAATPQQGTLAERMALPPLTIPAAQGGAEAGSEFQAFLHGLEGDLVGAVRAYAGSVRSDDWTAESEVAASQESGSSGVDTLMTEETETTEEQARPVSEITDDSNATSGGEVMEEAEERPTLANRPPTPIPAFHPQLGQNLPLSGATAQADRYGVSGGRNGQPRNLNFFRAHLFPPIAFGPSPEAEGSEASPTTAGTASAAASSSASGSTGSAPPIPNDPNAIVPCIFVGVRSVQRDAESNPEDLLNEPGVFGGTPSGTNTDTPSGPASGNDLPGPSTPAADSTRPSLSRVTSPPLSSTPAPRSFRERFLSRLSRRAPLAPTHPVNTYIVYVIGGNYPANHPILRIPALLTGAPLTDEDMALISELMGPAKAPTATKEDIERAGLKTVDGAQMAQLGRDGEVMDNCTERCLICLGEYEEGEECRVLGCKHGYHMACVDQWLEKGSNSCPACRTEAVDTTKTGPAASTSTAGPAGEVDEELPSLSPPIPVSSVPAGPAGPNLAVDVD